MPESAKRVHGIEEPGEALKASDEDWDPPFHNSCGAVSRENKWLWTVGYQPLKLIGCDRI